MDQYFGKGRLVNGFGVRSPRGWLELWSIKKRQKMLPFARF
jgi:hypothetical protein